MLPYFTIYIRFLNKITHFFDKNSGKESISTPPTHILDFTIQKHNSISKTTFLSDFRCSEDVFTVFSSVLEGFPGIFACFLTFFYGIYIRFSSNQTILGVNPL